jgi:hypothetical protein
MQRQNLDKDLENVLVDVSITDCEIFTYLLTSQKPVERSVEMKYSEYKSIKNFARVMLAGILISGAVTLYSSAIQEHGSISKAYDAFMQQVDKLPARMYNL